MLSTARTEDLLVIGHAGIFDLKRLSMSKRRNELFAVKRVFL